MNFNLSLKGTVKNNISNIDFMQPLYEAITNSLEANAVNIEIEFFKKDNDLIENDPIINSFLIKDDGDGFNKDNLKSFFTLYSDHKINKGCKGIGRFTWLKVFNTINIISKIKNKQINIDFSIEYNENTSFKEIEINNNQNETIIYFRNITDKYENKTRTINLEEILKNIENNLLITLFSLKQDKKKFTITLKYNDNKQILTEKDINNLYVETFEIEDTINKTNYSFQLYYNFVSNSINNFYYCANGRAVKTFNIGIDNKKKLLNNENVNMLLTSEYLNKICNNERNDFIISQEEHNPKIDAGIVFPIIIEQLKKICYHILIKKFPQIVEENKKIDEEIKNKYPYLLKYSNNIEFDIIKNKETILKKLHNNFLIDKQEKRNNFEKMLSKTNITVDDFNKNILQLNEICTYELAEYIVYRNYILDTLQKLINDNNKIEKIMHNLFMQMGTTSEQENEQSLKLFDTNMWLLDDKFMYYNHIFSDIKIKTIKQELLENNKKLLGNNQKNSEDLKEPDLTIFYKKNKDDSLDVIVIEFKGIGTKNENKLNAVTEINRNIGYLKKNLENKYKINSFYGYIITQITDIFEEELLYNDFQKNFSNAEKSIYYSYNKSSKAHIYVLSIENIVIDAKLRNNIFLDILKNNNNLEVLKKNNN